MHDAIAIIGMGARFPGASDLLGYRRLVRGLHSTPSPVPRDRWDHAVIHDPNPRQATKTPATKGFFLDNIADFSPEFFGITPKRAKIMDPQQRLVLEVTRQALEDSGYARRRLAEGRVGVYVGASSVDHRIFVSNSVGMACDLAGRSGIAPNLTPTERAAITSALPTPHAYTIVGQQGNMIAANVSQSFDFHGPALTIDTACSSALAALHEAVLHLRAGIVGAAAVSGVYVILDPTMMVCFSQIGALSFTDSCRPFQTESDGFVLGEGAGTVILKRLADAESDGDRVVAVIRGIAMNNDGFGGGPLTPTVAGESAVIRSAWENAGVDPNSVGLLEAHATGTQAGDGIEVEALEHVFGHARTSPIPITSVKASIGHGLSSAGMASLIKASLAVSEGFIPPQKISGHLRNELPGLRNCLRVSDQLSPWESSQALPRRAGISSFGFGGTNVHVVLEEPVAPRRSHPKPQRYRFDVSAPSQELLAGHLLDLAAALVDKPLEPADVSHTLSLRRTDAQQVSFAASTAEELARELKAAAEAVRRGERPSTGETESSVGSLVTLPPSPLSRRRFWLMKESQESGPSGKRPSVTQEDAALRLVIDSICTVTSRGPEDVLPSHRLVGDLGFDSLTTLEFMTVLSRQAPTVVMPGRDSFNPTLTVQELATLLTQALATSKSRPDATLAPWVYDQHQHPWLLEHRPGGKALLPLAAMTEACTSALGTHAGGPVTAGPFSLLAPVEAESGRVELHFSVSDDLSYKLTSGKTQKPVGTGKACRGITPSPLLQRPTGKPGDLPLTTFYSEFAFHGPALRALTEVPIVSDTGAVGVLAASPDPVVILDGALQLALYWMATKRKQSTVVTGFESFRRFAPWPAVGTLHCVATLSSETDRELLSDFDFFDRSGALIAQWRGVRSPILNPFAQAPLSGDSPWPEIQELSQRKAAVLDAGFKLPYFVPHDGVAGATTRIRGRNLINYSSYNYLGLSGLPQVTEAAVEALRKFGTSASASRVASGERPLHGALEEALANFLGCEAALTLVSGHATNVTLIGHLFGPEDLVLHDSLAHDCIVSGARLSGAKRLAFPHNDMAALERLLMRERANVRRVLIAVEGVYSMDGDLAPLPEIIRLKQRFNAVVLVDEAHSIGVLGATGRGAGEHFGIERSQVDFWMGTLSKAFASCGGYLAGSKEMIDYLRYTLPGFIYSVGLPPASAASALAAVSVLNSQPHLPRQLQARSEFFRRKCRERGIDTGFSQFSAVIPCITGSSDSSLRLSQALEEHGINVQPIFYPAVEEGKARLRFFITSDHTDEQLATTVAILGDELADLTGRRLQVSP